MSLEVRKQRSDKNPPAGQKKALGVLLAATPATADVDLRPDPWHHLRVRIQGDTMEAWLAGVRVASLRSPGIGHPTKTSFGFTVNGSAIDNDNVKNVQGN